MINKAEMSGSDEIEIQMRKHIALVLEEMETTGLAEFCDNFVYAGAGYQLALEECYNDFGPLKATLKRIIRAKEAAQEAEAMRNRFEGKQKINVEGQQETLSRKRSCSESFHEEEEDDDGDDDIDNEAEADTITRTSEPPQFASALLEYYQLPNSIFI